MPELHFHIGPVQGFIAEARRTRDYWAGSFLLSWLSAQAMAGVEANGDTITKPEMSTDPVYLAVKGHGSGNPFLGTLANHFSASVLNNFDVENNCVAPVRAKWKELSDAVWKFAFDDFAWGNGEQDRVKQIWDSQINSFWEIYWIKTNDGEDWLNARKFCRIGRTAEAHFGAMGTGNFCTMMHGWQEISGYARHNERDQQNQFWGKLRQRLVDIRYPGKGYKAKDCLDLRENERLSAPALIKRLFPLLGTDELVGIIGWRPEITGIIGEWVPNPPVGWQERFLNKIGKWNPADGTANFSEMFEEYAKQHLVCWPSTSYIAAAHWIARVQREAPDLAEKFATTILEISPKYGRAEQHLWLRCVKESANKHPLGVTDGEVMYPDTLEGLKKDYPKAGNALNILQEINSHKMGTGKKIGNPSPYYAILRMDGDRMGHLMSSGQAEQATRALNDFNLSIRGVPDAPTDEEKMGIVTAHNGIVMFAGGDDLLALFPIEDVVPAALAVRAEFIKSFKSEDLPNETLSGAISIVDRKAPLRWALEENLKLMEEVAKGVSERNSLAFNLMLPGRVSFQWAVPWKAECDGDDVHPVELMNIAIEQTISRWPALASNSFYHGLREKMEPFFEEDEGRSHSERLVAEKPEITANDLLIAGNMIWLLAEGSEGETRPDLDDAKGLVQLCRVYRRPDAGADHEAKKTVLTSAPLKLIRLITRHWCKEGV